MTEKKSVITVNSEPFLQIRRDKEKREEEESIWTDQYL